jgi:hypothetical protein
MAKICGFRFSGFWRCVFKTTRDYILYLRQSHTDLAILFALVSLILAAGDGLVMWLLGCVAPALAAQLGKLDRTVLRSLFGVLPATIILIVGVMRSGWLAFWQKNRLEAEKRERSAPSPPPDLGHR